MTDGYVNGYIQRMRGGSYEGEISIDGITLPAISAVYFKKDGESYLWLKRKKILDYDEKTMMYKEREARPQWEAYLKKQLDGETVAYKGEFFFMHFRYSVVGVWDNVLGMDKQRLNLFVERLPMSQQIIVNNINSQKKKNNDR